MGMPLTTVNLALFSIVELSVASSNPAKARCVCAVSTRKGCLPPSRAVLFAEVSEVMPIHCWRLMYRHIQLCTWLLSGISRLVHRLEPDKEV